MLTSQQHLVNSINVTQLLDNLETMGDGSHDVFNHPEAILIKTAFGPAFCDSFSMMDRFTLLLKTM